jgi:hypothetical protein
MDLGWQESVAVRKMRAMPIWLPRARSSQTSMRKLRSLAWQRRSPEAAFICVFKRVALLKRSDREAFYA